MFLEEMKENEKMEGFIESNVNVRSKEMIK